MRDVNYVGVSVFLLESLTRLDLLAFFFFFSFSVGVSVRDYICDATCTVFV